VNRFFWVKLGDLDDLEVAMRVEDKDVVTGEKLVLWFICGSEQEYTGADLVIGTEIHPGRTGLLAALNDVK